MARELLVHLLLIDDDDLSREVLELLLSEAGFAPISFPRGEDALAHLRSADPPDAVLSDLQMPGLQGEPLARALRALCPPRVPIIVMSASTPSPAELAAFDGFLPKPFTPADLHRILAPQLPGSQTIDLAASAAPDARTAPGPAPGAPAEILDDHTFSELAALMRPHQLHELFTLCFGEIARHAAAMHHALIRGDRDGFRKEAHALKGAAGMVGARELQALASSLEQNAANPANHLASLREIPPAAERLRRMLLSHGVSLDAVPLPPHQTQGDSSHEPGTS